MKRPLARQFCAFWTKSDEKCVNFATSRGNLENGKVTCFKGKSGSEKSRKVTKSDEVDENGDISRSRYPVQEKGNP